MVYSVNQNSIMWGVHSKEKINLKKVKVFKAVILGIIVVFLVCAAGYILKEIFVADTEEILIDILTKPENVSLDTTSQKNRYCYYQIVDGILYLDGKDGFCQYDFVKEEWKTIWSGEVNNYKIVGRNVFCMEPAGDSEELWNVLSRNLDNFNEKKVLIEKVFDCVFCEGCIYYSRFDENSEKRYICQFDTNTSKSRTIFCIDSQVDDEIRYGEMVAASKNYFLFCEAGGVWIYNRKAGQWNRFRMNFNETNLYFWIHDIQINQTDLYIQGLVCNTEKSSIAGYYVEENAAENGIWKVNLETGQRKQVVNNIYYGGIYILGDVLYAVDDGKYETFVSIAETSCEDILKNTAGETVTSDAMSGGAIDSNIVSGKAITEDKVQSGNSYYMKSGKTNYKGDFTFSDDDIDTKDVNVKCVFLGNSRRGKLYHLTFDSVEGAAIPKKLLNLGYFYVREKEIFRILEISEKQKRDILDKDQIPDDATLVCSEKGKKDKNKRKGVHEKITVNDDIVEYSYYNNSVETLSFYETIFWKKDVGMILYRRGYGAELEAITLWLEKYVNNPHEFDIKGNK